jgi:hypothetical protein
MSYGQVLGYTHCGDPLNVLYGFAALYLIGFLWGAMGGAGTALPAYLTRERLTGLLPPFLWFFGVLAIHDLTYDPLNVWLAGRTGLRLTGGSAFRQEEPLYWFDTDWTTALLGVATPLVYRAVRRRTDPGTGLMLHMAIGWWVGFLLFPVLLDWRMTPPRGDNWAGCLGLAAGMWVYLWRNGLVGVVRASIVTGFVGGAGFAGATAMQILWLRTGWTANWHSVLEQTYGLINGIGIGVAMAFAARHAPPVTDDPPVRRWTDWFAPAAVLIGVVYLNARKNPEEWVKAGSFAETLYWFQPVTWFNLGSLALGAAVVVVLVNHMRRPVAVIPPSWVGKGQLLFLALLAAGVVMNFERAVVSFAEQRLITEGVILLNACLVAVLAVLWSATHAAAAPPATADRIRLGRLAGIGSFCAVACCLACLGVVLGAFGTEPVGFRNPNVRFGRDATASGGEPKRGAPHP